MIRVRRNDLSDISEAYYEHVSKIGAKTKNPIYLAFEPLLKKYVLSPLCDFSSLIKEFNSMFKDEIEIFTEVAQENKPQTEYGKFISYMEGRYQTVISYKIRTSYERTEALGVWLSSRLNINTCPYCNRQYTFTVNKAEQIRPQFDHFYPKSKYPFFALSFFNLIPCCFICNHSKSDKEFQLLHPYQEGFEDKCCFEINHRKYIFENHPISIKLKIKDIEPDFQRKCQNNIDIFALQPLYEMHSDYIEEIVDKAYAYNEDYYMGLIEEFVNLGKTSSEIERLVFGNYINTADNEKRPLSKLTYDILNQIGIKKGI